MVDDRPIRRIALCIEFMAKYQIYKSLFYYSTCIHKEDGRSFYYEQLLCKRTKDEKHYSVCISEFTLYRPNTLNACNYFNNL